MTPAARLVALCACISILAACGKDGAGSGSGGGSSPSGRTDGRTFAIAPGPNATTDMVAAMVQAAPGDVISFGCGFFDLTQTLQLINTEDVLIKDFDQTSSMFSRLCALGIQVAMDDFGTGFTSLGNLRRLNFDRLKIDRIFTNDLPNHRRSAAIVRSMFVLARELDLEVTVEGVETYEQYAFLRAEGGCELQGYLFSQPKPASAFNDPAALQFAAPAPRKTEPAAPAGTIPIAARQAKRVVYRLRVLFHSCVQTPAAGTSSVRNG